MDKETKGSEMDNKNQMSTIISQENHSPWKFWKKRRVVVSIMAFFGFFNIYSLRVNLSIAIVAMTSSKTITTENGTIITEPPEFDWDSKMQGYILSSFFYGYITTQVLGGWFAARIGGKKVFGIGIGVTAILTLFTPLLANANVYLLLVVRIIEGVFEGVTFPCIHAIWAVWAPPLERSRLATLAFSGSYVGTVVAMPVCAKLADTLGWESIFYVFGGIGVIWLICWWLIVADSPETDRFISPEELKYLNETLSQVNTNKRITHPWKSILLSVPVWAIVVSHVSENWGFYTLLTQLPKFLKEALDFDLEETGYLSAIPYLAMAIMIQFSGYFADWFQVKGILTTTQVRRIFNCGAFIAQTTFMMAAGFWMNPQGVVFCLTMAVGLGAFAWAGFSVNHLDIAPQHASVLMGFSNTFATLPGIVSPILTGYVVTSGTVEEWRTVFYVTSGVYLIGCVIYGLFASGELQPWAVETEDLKKSTEKNGHDNKTFEPDQV